MWRDQTGEKPDLVTLPYAENPRYCPVRLLDRWLELAQITTGPVFRGVHRHNTVLDGRLTPGAANKDNRQTQKLVRLGGVVTRTFSAF